MKKETVLLIAITLIVGLLIGILVSKGGKKMVSPPSGTPAPAPAVNYQQNIKMLEGIVASDPANRNAWVELGHNYFDSDQPVKAVEAYNKALELDPNDPNVLTDQGVMFRRLGWFDRAVENFTRAYELDPSHRQSLYNLGIVYRYDLQDFEKAREAWAKYLVLSPSGPGSDQVRAEMEFLQTQTRPESR
ncbi:tetratricopeptide repeat protein [Desulfuromonas sp. TF]|uniref:tetratricopeptide repeat protein n=1 Tax=Desulfuromonas sp. TF TaxID=1232410 RepID=UPI00041763FA|nr:tetratricopeptide repeat protein [Desulfuromonas sp. TF]